MSRKLSQFYCKHPLIAGSLTGATLFLTADVSAQQLILKREDKHDYVATIKSAILGLASGPVLCTWYGYLEGLIGPYECFRPAFNKMLLDQTLFKPIFFGIPFLASDLTSLEKPEETFNLEAYKNLMLYSYKFTPLLMFLTFRFVPCRNRVPVTQVMGAVWWFAHTIKKEKGQSDDGKSGGAKGGQSAKKSEKKK